MGDVSRSDVTAIVPSFEIAPSRPPAAQAGALRPEARMSRSSRLPSAAGSDCWVIGCCVMGCCVIGEAEVAK